jgi:hypothetical protein
MFARMLSGLVGGVVTLAVAMTPVTAQVAGRVVIAQGPIAADIVFGARRDAAVVHPRTVRYREPVVVRYRVGMSEAQLDRYLDRIEREYDLYRHMDDRRAWVELGWSHDQLREYVRWLRDERSYLRAEHARLERLERRGHGRGHGRGVAVAAGHER